jgi:hypothetical protein
VIIRKNIQLEIKNMSYASVRLFLTEINWQLLSSIQEFEEKRGFKLCCNKGHEAKLTKDSFARKKLMYEKTRDFPCKFCTLVQIELDKIKRLVLKTTGHCVLNFDKDEKLKYQCGNCHQISVESIQNLRKSKGVCDKCQTQEYVLPIDYIQLIVQEKGMELEHYENNKNITITCACGNTGYLTTLLNIKTREKCSDICNIVKQNKRLEKEYQRWFQRINYLTND